MQPSGRGEEEAAAKTGGRKRQTNWAGNIYSYDNGYERAYMKLQLASCTRLLFSHTCISSFFPVLTAWGRQLSLLEKSFVYNFRVGQTKCRLGLQYLHLQAMEKCKRTLHKNSGKSIARHSLPPHYAPPPLGKQNQRGINAMFPLLQAR